MDLVEMLTSTVLVAAGAFAVANGANDGGSLVSIGLKLPAFRPWQAIAIMAVAVGLVPALLGTAVATTFATRLVVFSGPEGQIALLAALVTSAMVVFILTRRGIPTSLTLALVGGITGAGIGSSLPVASTMVVTVLAVAALAPLVGMVLSYGATRAWEFAPSSDNASRNVGRLHAFAFVLLCCAYGANDGQKMLAVFAVGAGATGTVAAHPTHLMAIGVLFAIGASLGILRLGARFGSGVLTVRPVNAVSAELSAAAAVLGSAAIGSPVSMTQVVAGSLVGTGVSDGLRRVRWRIATGIAMAWVITLPLAVVAAAALAYAGQVAL